MKKIYSLLATVLLMVGFAACEDVDNPFPQPGQGGDQSGDSTQVIAPAGDGSLENPFNAAAANAYVATLAADVNTEQDFYIKGKVASIEEAYNTQYGNGSFMISDDGTSANAFKVWRALYLENKKYEAGQKSLKVGDEVVVCGKLVNFKGNTPETAQGKAYLYSLNGKTVAEAGEEPTEPENPGAGDVTNPNVDASNGSFENWTGGKPVNWVSTTSASKGSVKQSTEAHRGTYAVEVTGSTSGNNRLAYTELVLPAGDYTMTFWVRAATSEGGSVRPGYAPINADGSMGTYTYGDYVNDLTTEWQQVTHTFSLTAETKLNVVVMVSKNPGKNVIIDDFQLSNASGTFFIK